MIIAIFNATDRPYSDHLIVNLHFLCTSRLSVYPFQVYLPLHQHLDSPIITILLYPIQLIRNPFTLFIPIRTRKRTVPFGSIYSLLAFPSTSLSKMFRVAPVLPSLLFQPYKAPNRRWTNSHKFYLCNIPYLKVPPPSPKITNAPFPRHTAGSPTPQPCSRHSS